MESAHQDDEISVSYLGLAAAMHSITAPAIRSAIQALELDAGSRGLDVGCGVGTHTRWLAEAVVPNGQVTGLDLSTECLARARKAAAKSELAARVSFRHGDMSDLPFSDDSFDWAWSADTLWIGPPGQELPARDPLSILRELSRVVRPGGTIALVFWSSQRLLPGYPLLEARLNATYAANYPYTDAARPELHILRALGWLQEAGLEDPTAHTFVADVHAPLEEVARKALLGSFQMLWRNAEGEVSSQDWAAFRRLCQPGSRDLILDLPDYYAFISYSLFHGRVPR
jgi:ubiquinone/menaquinone biosynthesis C-methylase UbiE